jgi:hypothetical protein
VHLDGREAFAAVHHELIVRCQIRQRQQRRLELGGVHVHTLDHQHVVGAALDARHPHRGPAAAARLEIQARHVAGPEAEDGQRPLGETGQDELALRARRQRLARPRVHHLGQEVVLVDVEAVPPLGTLGRDAGPDDLAEAVEVDRVDAPQSLDLAPQAFRPGLGAEEPVPQADAPRVHPMLAHRLADVERE